MRDSLKKYFKNFLKLITFLVSLITTETVETFNPQDQSQLKGKERCIKFDDHLEIDNFIYQHVYVLEGPALVDVESSLICKFVSNKAFFISNSSLFFSKRSRQRSVAKLKRIKPTKVSIERNSSDAILSAFLTSSNIGNFYHFICDFIPIVEYLLRYSEIKRTNIRIYIHSKLKALPYLKDYLSTIPLSIEFREISIDIPVYFGDSLITPLVTETGIHSKLKQRLIDNYLDRFKLDDNIYQVDILLVTRNNYPGDLDLRYYRKILDDFSHKKILFMDPNILNLREQFQIFQRSKIIVSPHGGALACTVACKSNVIIEISANSWYNNCFKSIAEINNITHYTFYDGIRMPKFMSARRKITFKKKLYNSVKNCISLHLD